MMESIQATMVFLQHPEERIIIDRCEWCDVPIAVGGTTLCPACADERRGVEDAL